MNVRSLLLALLLGGFVMWAGSSSAWAQDAAAVTVDAALQALPTDAGADANLDQHEASAPATHAAPSGSGGASGGASGGGHGYSPHWAWILPFVVVLACIALAPLINPHWWEKNYPYVAAVLFVVGLIYYAFVRNDLHPWLHEMKEYVSFIALLFALFMVSGGIAIDVSRKATPMANCTLLLLGAVIANIFGTTGAAMLLIRPYIRINRKHIKPYHICFFIFLVANVGGSLTPVGDPPLFLGYLKGVPFWWVIQHCWQPWLVATGLLLGVFYVLDRRDHAKEERHDWGEHDTGPAVRISGIHNFMFILVVVAAVFRPSVFDAVDQLVAGGAVLAGLGQLVVSREVLMVAAALASKWVTARGIYERNEFTYAPIIEVAVLFLAIFSTMVPALEWLDSNADRLPLDSPGQYYFATGGLSSVLDNAPTYLTFLQTRLGEIDPAQVQAAQEALAQIHAQVVAEPGAPLVVPPGIESPHVRQAVHEMITDHPDDVRSGVFDVTEVKLAFLIGVPENNIFLVAVSIGAVFFGAFTYIGNAPNFMVKSIAESSGIQMPTFLGYVLRYAVPFLLPVYIIIWVIFFLFPG